jgi:hypothetical protein
MWRDYKKLRRQDVPFVDIGSGPCPRPSHLLASRELVVHDSDLRDVTMEPILPLSVTGEIHFEDIPKEWRSFRVEAQSVTLSPADEIPSLRGAQILGGCPPRVRLASDGTFIFESVTGGELPSWSRPGGCARRCVVSKSEIPVQIGLQCFTTIDHHIKETSYD